MWLPETAVNDERARACSPRRACGSRSWRPDRRSGCDRWERATSGTVDDGSVGTRHTYRWCHPERRRPPSTLVFYDGALSHDVAFGLGSLVERGARRRAEHAAADLTTAEWCASRPTARRSATTIDTAERAVAYALAVESARHAARHVAWPTVARRRTHRRARSRVHESAWSCAHGVGRWKEDCGCHTGGRPGWNQQWRRRCATRSTCCAITASRSSTSRAGGAARSVGRRDAYVDVVLGARDRRVRRALGPRRSRRDRDRGADAARGPAPRDAHVHVVRLVLQRPRGPRDRAGAALRRAARTCSTSSARGLTSTRSSAFSTQP